MNQFRYNKTENLNHGDREMFEFTHLIVEAKSKYSTNIKPYTLTHDIVDYVEAFHKITFNYYSFPPIRIKMKPVLFILKRKENYKELLPLIPKIETIETTSVEDSEEISNVLDKSKDEEITYEEKVANLQKELMEGDDVTKSRDFEESFRDFEERLKIELMEGKFKEYQENKLIKSTNDKENKDNKEDFEEKLKIELTEGKFSEYEDDDKSLEKENKESKVKKYEKINEDEIINELSKESEEITIIKEEINKKSDLIKKGKVEKTNKEEKIKTNLLKDEKVKINVLNDEKSKLISKSMENFETQSEKKTVKKLIKRIVEENKKEDEKENLEKDKNQDKHKKLEKDKKLKDKKLEKHKKLEKIQEKNQEKIQEKIQDEDKIQKEDTKSDFKNINKGKYPKVKENIKNIIRDFKKNQILTKIKPKSEGAKQTIKKIIEEDRTLVEMEELKKLQNQILDIIENNPNILNKETIKAKINEAVFKDIIDESKLEVKPKVVSSKKVGSEEGEKSKEDKDDKYKEYDKYVRFKEDFSEEITIEESEDVESESTDIEKSIIPKTPSVYDEFMPFNAEFEAANEHIENLMLMLEDIVSNMEVNEDLYVDDDDE